jgi:hypothetical protein
MGFGGGGSAGLTNHVHNNVPLQGGPLDFANDTIASLNVGSTTFSDGAALQELVIGNAGELLKVNGGGTAPEWAAGAVTTNVQTDVLTSDFTTTSTTAVTIGLSLTATTSAGGTADVLCGGTWWSSPVDYNGYTRLYDDGVAVSNTTQYIRCFNANLKIGWSFVWAVPTDGSVLDIRGYVQSGGTLTMDGTQASTSLVLSEVY